MSLYHIFQLLSDELKRTAHGNGMTGNVFRQKWLMEGVKNIQDGAVIMAHVYDCSVSYLKHNESCVLILHCCVLRLQSETFLIFSMTDTQ